MTVSLHNLAGDTIYAIDLEPRTLGWRWRRRRFGGRRPLARRSSVSCAPYLRAAFPGHFVTIVGVAVALAMVGAFALALARIRHARAIRYAVIAASVGVAIAYTLATQTGIPEVDVVERVHFIEYGAIAFLFYLAFRPLGDFGMFILPVLAALIVGTLRRVAAVVHPESRRRSA